MPLADSDVTELFLPTIGIVILVGGLFGAIWFLRKKVKEPQELMDIPPAGFTLTDLRDLLKSGQISQAEFERAKEKLLAEAKKEAHVKQPPSSMG
jgi:hypothetical protein